MRWLSGLMPACLKPPSKNSPSTMTSRTAIVPTSALASPSRAGNHCCLAAEVPRRQRRLVFMHWWAVCPVSFHCRQTACLSTTRVVLTSLFVLWIARVAVGQHGRWRCGDSIIRWPRWLLERPDMMDWKDGRVGRCHRISTGVCWSLEMLGEVQTSVCNSLVRSTLFFYTQQLKNTITHVVLVGFWRFQCRGLF